MKHIPATGLPNLNECRGIQLSLQFGQVWEAQVQYTDRIDVYKFNATDQVWECIVHKRVEQT